MKKLVSQLGEQAKACLEEATATKVSSTCPHGSDIFCHHHHDVCHFCLGKGKFMYSVVSDP